MEEKKSHHTQSSRAAHKKKIVSDAQIKEQVEATPEKSDSCLLILRDEGQAKLTMSKSSSKERPISCDNPGRKAPPVNRTSSASSTSLRTTTPTKYVTLQTVRRKEEGVFSECDIQNNGTGNTDILFHPVNTFNPAPHSTDSHPTNADGLGNKSATWTVPTSSPAASQQINGSAVTHAISCHGDSTQHDDEEESSSDSEPIKAPNELMLEFLDCVMKADYTNAQKLCKMILIYEPENADALNFRSLIDEKIALGNTTTDSDEDTDGDSSSTNGDSNDSEDNESSDDDD